MVGWMDDEALHRTLTTGRTTFWSRSRQEYWVKGETSGHRQHVKEVRLDCDGDTLLVKVDQEGPACHTGDRTCFDADRPAAHRWLSGPAAGPSARRVLVGLGGAALAAVAGAQDWAHGLRHGGRGRRHRRSPRARRPPRWRSPSPGRARRLGRGPRASGPGPAGSSRWSVPSPPPVSSPRRSPRSAGPRTTRSRGGRQGRGGTRSPPR